MRGKEEGYQVMEYDAATVLANIRAERARKHLKVSDISLKLGISESTYYQKEKGNSDFTLTELISLCQYMGVSIGTLLEKPA